MVRALPTLFLKLKGSSKRQMKDKESATTDPTGDFFEKQFYLRVKYFQKVVSFSRNFF